MMWALMGTVLIGLVGNALAGAWWLDPLVGLLIAGLAVREGLEAWRGDGCGCVTPPPRDADTCEDGRCAGS